MPSQIITSTSNSQTDIRNQDEKMIDFVADQKLKQRQASTTVVSRSKTFNAELPLVFSGKNAGGYVSPTTVSEWYLAGSLPSASDQGISNVSNIILNVNSGYTFRNFPLGSLRNINTQIWMTIFEFNTTIFGTGSNFQPLFSSIVGNLVFSTVSGFTVDVSASFQLNRTIPERGIISSQRDFINFPNDQLTDNEYQTIIQDGYKNLFFGLFVDMNSLTFNQRNFLLSQFDPANGITKDFAGFLFTADINFTYVATQNL